MKHTFKPSINQLCYLRLLKFEGQNLRYFKNDRKHKLLPFVPRAATATKRRKFASFQVNYLIVYNHLPDMARTYFLYSLTFHISFHIVIDRLLSNQQDLLQSKFDVRVRCLNRNVYFLILIRFGDQSGLNWNTLARRKNKEL